MEFHELLQVVGDEPVFRTGLLLAGDVDPADVHRQFSRWTKSGLLYQLRRGVYALAPPYQKVKPHPFLVANRMVRGSYVSLQSALAFYDLIPEAVPVTTSVTTGRPSRWATPLGDFEFRHVKRALFFGYRLLDLGGRQQAFVCLPEKGLLDLIYLQPGGDDPAFLAELRLQNLERVDGKQLLELAVRSQSPKLQRAAAVVNQMAIAEVEEYETL